ncbi:MAG: uracil-DNA glycosylase [Pleomorphochaeta sp.]
MNNQIEKLLKIIDDSKVAFSDDYLSFPKDEEIQVKKTVTPDDFKKRFLERQNKFVVDNKEKIEPIQINEVRDENLFEMKEEIKEFSKLTYQELQELVKTCKKCPAAQIRKQSLFGKGDNNPKLMIIGEGPGREEDTNNDLFVGKSGQYLRKWLAAINLTFEKDVYLTNIVKCYSKTNPTKEMAISCLPYLQRQIEIVNPKVILILGKVAAVNLLNKDTTMKNLRGNIYSYKRVPSIVTYHPAAVLRNPQWRAPVWEDLQKVDRLIKV